MGEQPWLSEWVLLTAILLTTEFVSLRLVALPFALGAACAALAGYLGAPLGYQWVLFVGLGSVLFVVFQRPRRPRYVGRHRVGAHARPRGSPDADPDRRV